MKTVYVVQWEYNNGGGFDWYIDRKISEKAMQVEAQNQVAWADCNWFALYRVMRVKSRRPDKITEEVKCKLYGGGK